ncbi:MAG: LacI family transcriptional regulator [Treponema sp.]|nr:LacI family transcriptional regulator [Treponema sp.]
MRYTIKDIAAEANVSVSTVSKCLNGYSDIGEETKKLVLQTIERMDYVPNTFARYISHNSTYVIGLTVPDIKDPYSAQTNFGIETGLMEKNYDLIIGNLDRNEERFLKFVKKAREMRFDGLIVTPDKYSPAIIESLNRLDIPVLSIRRRPPKNCSIPYIDCDHHDTATQMLEYLYKKGHRKIAHIVLPNEGGMFRSQAYKAFCKKYELELRLAAIDIPAGILSKGVENGSLGCKEILEKWPDTTAIFCGSDFIALGAMNYLRQINLSVPEDISVAGIGNVEVAELSWFNLTTMDVNRYEMGRKAAQLILNGLNGKPIKNTLFHSTLVERGSVRSI